MEIHIFISGQFVIKTGILEHDAERFPDAVLFMKAVSVHLHVTACRMEHGRQDLDGRGFPCTVRSEKCENLSFPDLERDIIHSPDAMIECFHQMFDIDDHGSDKR